ncbi:unnamed protein product [Tilletia controversa]|nr:unnamed protein product [Tilletia controversa]CAD6920907.1 unnamed protein product [Tilletia controversa]
MPAIVQEDERRAARLRHPRSLQRALKLADDAQAEEILADLLKDQSEGENFSLTSTDMQTRLIDFALEAQEWHEEYYIPQHATGAFGNELQIPSDFFDYDSVPGLVHRATLFMSFKRKFCSAHSGIGRPSIPTLKSWAHLLIANNACDFLRRLATKVGLTLSGFHQIRKGFAQNITVALGPDVARTALDHNMKENTLDRHYTTGVGIYDFARIRYGESLDAAITERVAASTMKANEMFGQAMKAMAGGSRVDAKLGTRPHREYGYIKEQLLKDPEYKIAYEELETQKQKLEAESGISFEGLQLFGQHQLKRARTALEALEKPTDIVDATLEAIERERKLRKAKRQPAERRLQEEETRSSMTREGLATATDAIVQAERKRIAALEDAIAAQIQRMADAPLPTEKEGVAPQPHSVDHRLLSKVRSSGHAGPSGSNRHDTTTEVQDEFEGDVTEADILTIPHRVQKISSVDDAGSEAKVNFDTTTARLALIRSLAGDGKLSTEEYGPPPKISSRNSLRHSSRRTAAPRPHRQPFVHDGKRGQSDAVSLGSE